MDIDLDHINPEGLEENEEGEGVNQPHSGERSKKCYQCDFASSQAGNIWKRTVEKSQTNATSVIMHPLVQAIWGNIW